MAGCCEDGGTGAESFGGPGIIFAVVGSRDNVEVFVVFYVIDVEFVRANADDGNLMLGWLVIAI